MGQTVMVPVSFYTQLPIILEKMGFTMLGANLGCHLGKRSPEAAEMMSAPNTEYSECLRFQTFNIQIFQDVFHSLNF